MLPPEKGSSLSPLHKLAAKILWQGSLFAALAINTLVTPFWWSAVFFFVCTAIAACYLYDNVMMFKFVYENTRE
jgi:hypothetical protein